ncbi:hypothetical protein FNO01nite_10560 [Flavobacterium noncentrifugens]|uniref:Glycosyltransferase involved in cell wall bisynthesis n=1 Tax=Flavobacterium noncentrifugens TaxID=1128970 RepID=A0A1G8V8E3_9FLAO|nr:glycosyltransferase [Flavobacterium noncentrifugens]GEP50384.1 hypothetical protein FNO01nite_10560 [Flavobacterium noncentrifugens]SDJ62239.1 Glycosyltransferase involved in cell wall bisynthesis [Flavobacterium noncentrifugens]
MLVSIVVPVYNVERYLARCLDSLLDQDLQERDYEIVIVNDGSPDKSLDIATHYAQKHQNIKVISQQNQGLSGARNTGIDHASGKYLFFVDSDDYIEKDILKYLTATADTGMLDFLGFDLVMTRESNLSVKSELPSAENLKIYNGCDYIAQYNYPNNAVWYLVNTQFLKEMNLRFEPGRLVEDGMFTTELLLRCQRAAYVKVSVYRYFVNDNSIMTIRDRKHLEKMNNDFLFVIKKFSGLVALANEKKANENAIRRLKARQESYAFFLFVRLVKSKMPYREFRKIIDEMRVLKVYPIRNFIGTDYCSPKEKLFTGIFNSPLLLRTFLKANSIFKIVR